MTRLEAVVYLVISSLLDCREKDAERTKEPSRGGSRSSSGGGDRRRIGVDVHGVIKHHGVFGHGVVGHLKLS